MNWNKCFPGRGREHEGVLLPGQADSYAGAGALEGELVSAFSPSGIPEQDLKKQKHNKQQQK